MLKNAIILSLKASGIMITAAMQINLNVTFHVKISDMEFKFESVDAAETQINPYGETPINVDMKKSCIGTLTL
jgi:hypothetical protein